MTRSATATSGFYRWIASHPRLVDAVLATAFLLFTGVPYALLAWQAAVFSVDVAERFALLAIDLALVLPLYWRRTRPVAAATVMLVPCLIQVVADLDLVAAQPAVLVMIAALAGYGPRWASWAGLGAGLGGIVLLVVRSTALSTPADPMIGVVITLVTGWSLVGVAWLIGDLTRSRRLERAALADRADRLERERERELKLAAADERAHIAREMHDIVAHSLSIIVTQADGARYAAPPSAGPVVPALEAIAETARTSLTDMRRLLGVLRTDDAAPTAPAPTADDLPALIASVRASGLPVAFTVGGDPPPLTQGASLVLYRVVQESLTNVMKHAGTGARARVRIDWGDDAVTATIDDSGRGLDSAEAAGGHGLEGMRERLALYDGEVQVSDSEQGGVRVRARMPYASAVTRG